jgi:hypothetical protein
MTARGEMVKAAGLTNPNPETAVAASAAADAAPGGLPPHAQVLLRFSGIAVAAASP